ncbi:MAG TPA: hypothetical protein PKX92_01715 [Edaphocola sp.]|nr:hypothetical protein [Edaphocola sp.]
MSEKIRELKPRKVLNKAFLKVKPNRAEIEGFLTSLIALIYHQTLKNRKESYLKELL